MPDRLLRDYLDKVRNDYRYVDFRGIAQLERVVALELDEVFVPLNATVSTGPERAGTAARVRRVLDGWPDPSGYADPLFAWTDPDDRATLIEVAKWANVRPDDVLYEHLVRYLESQPASGDGNRPEGLATLLARHRQLVVLGDPGSGKSTVAKWLARTYALGRQAVKERLGVDEELVPVVVPVAAYVGWCGEQPDDADTDPLVYVKAFHDLSTQGLGKRLAELARDGQALLLFDGLDEVPGSEDRRATSRQLQALARSCEAQGAAGSRLLVTSRIFGYDLCRLDGVPHAQLAPFDRAQITAFIKGWSWELEQMLHPKGARRPVAEENAQRLEHAIFAPGAGGSKSLEDFASNPLLLTILSLVHWQYGVLPERRVQLYEVAVNTLVSTWNRHRGLGGEVRGLELSADQAERLWQPVALWMHHDHPGGTAPRKEIIQQLAAGVMEQQRPRPKRPWPRPRATSKPRLTGPAC